MYELNQILLEARGRFQAVTAILGTHLIREVEDAVKRLHALHEKIESVTPTLDGIFLVGSEVMFIPTNDSIRIVNTIFAEVGNPFVAEHIDGILLLAARNLLIQAVSFYSYYGKQQIYNVVKKNSGAISQSAITHHIRGEIRTLFKACKAENRLVLKRVMSSAEWEFEISVDAIRGEAEYSAVAAVSLLLPGETPAAPVASKTLLQRLSAWLFR